MRSRTANWFICKIRYDKIMEDGLKKKVTETYVVDAVSFTEAEARIIGEMSDYISGELEVVEIDRAVFKEILFMDWAQKVIDNDARKLGDALDKKDKEAFKDWENQSLEDKMRNTDTRWYKSKLQFITTDKKTGNEKRTSVYYLVEGCSLESARRNIDEMMKGSITDYSIASVSETAVVDVFESKLI